MAENTTIKSMDDIVALCRRRGFIWQSSEMYGGINGFWDYGPLGAQLKKNLKDAWWNDIITCPPAGLDHNPIHVVPVDTTIIMHPKVWEASGHIGGFNDPMVDCRHCKARFRADHIDQMQCAKKPSKKPGEHTDCDLTEPRAFNLMFQTHTGAVQNDDSLTYLRPETAQGIFTQFWNVVDTSRVKVPFGMAQMGKSFRNEVTPRNFTFRSREFEQMEIEFFIHPDEAEQWYRYWRDSRYEWWQKVGLAGGNLILREHDKEELAHYAKEGAGVCDVEYRFPFTSPGYGELEGIAHRSNYDLSQHAKHCGKGDKLRYFDQEKNERYFPHVIEPSAGADRGTLALLCEAYTPTPDRKGAKAVMQFTPRMAPIKAGIFPLVNKDGMPEIAQKLYQNLRNKYTVQLDVKQNIGKRYARMDEAGTPYCFTIDGDTASDQAVTVRDRDTLEQQRISLDKVNAFLDEKING